ARRLSGARDARGARLSGSPWLSEVYHASLRLDLPDFPDAFGQPAGVGLEELRELVPLLEHDRGLELVHRAFEVAVVDGGPERVAQLGQHGLGRAARREDAGPDVELGVGIAELLERGHLGQRGDALVAPSCERAELARLDVRQDHRRARGQRVLAAVAAVLAR